MKQVFFCLLMAGLWLIMPATVEGRYYTLMGGGAMFNQGGHDDTELEDLEGFGVSPYKSIGAGFTMDRFRFQGEFTLYPDLEMRFRRTVPEGGKTIVFRHKRSGSAYGGWAWAFMDIPELEWKFLQPFVGAGLGATYFDTYPRDGLEFSYGFSAGVAAALTDALTLTGGYRVFDLAAAGSGNWNHTFYVGFQYAIE